MLTFKEIQRVAIAKQTNLEISMFDKLYFTNKCEIHQSLNVFNRRIGYLSEVENC